MRSSASWLQLAADVLILAGIMLNVVRVTRDDAPKLSGLTLRNRLAIQYRRHPRLFTAQVACAVVGLLLFIAYGVTFLA
jgi:hypothetical protein